MNENIIIDGYNLIRQSGPLLLHENRDLESGRNKLIDMLYNYKRSKSLKIAVVFDGWDSGRLSQQSYMEKGIRVIFSKTGQKADDVIKKIARESGKELIIVTSDNDIKDFANKTGNVVISSPEFFEKMEMAKYFNMKGMDDADEDSYGDSKISTQKKGNPKKLPKSERKRNRKMKKL